METESSEQNISSEDEKRIIDTLVYEKWRDDGKYEHMKRDIEKKQKKANAKIKANKHLSESGNPPFGQ
ncbi:MAG: hypothetical protein LBB89_02595 [Treponema sp.]|nr:hypothetical protein [Treponema sp.]